MNRIFTIITVLSFLCTTATSQDTQKKEKKRYEHFKERNISKTYPASGNSLHIDNQFGDVTVTTWDKNEIKVDIHIEASSTEKDIAEKTFSNLDVAESKDGNTIKFKTIIEKNKGNSYSCKNCSNTMSITYTVQIPAGNALRIENQFGGIQLPDYNGPISLTSKFGSLTTGTLAKAEKVWVEFGKATIKSIGNISATFKFSTIVVENLSGANKLNMEFCSASRVNLDNNLTSLTLNESYSTVNLRPASNFSASYSIRTSFSSVKDRSNANIERTDKPDQYGPDSEKSYQGKSGNGAAKIEIKSSFGTIIIGEATEEEMKGKNKNKKKAV